MLLKNTLKAATAISLLAATGAYADTLTIATVNNGDMIRMQGLTDDFTAKTGHNVCLLYTSPSPRDGLLSRMPSSA